MSSPSALHHIIGRLRFRHLALLAQLGDDPNVGRCAARLNMAQPTASKLLSEIEEIFGVKLFTRNRRGLTPTVAGQAMTRRAGILLAETQATHTELLATMRGSTGLLRLGVFPVAVPDFLSRFFVSLQRTWPGLVLSVNEGVEHQLLQALSAGQLDCIIGRVVMENLTPDLRFENLYREPTTVVCGTTHPINHATDSELADLLQQADWVLPAHNGAVYNMVASRLSMLNLPAPRVLVETTSVFVTIELLTNSNLLSILPQKVAQSYAAAGKIAIVRMAELTSNYPIGVIYRMDAAQTSLVRTVLQVARLIAINKESSANAEVDVLKNATTDAGYPSTLMGHTK